MDFNKLRTICKRLMEDKEFFPNHFQIQTVSSCNGSCVTCPNSYKKDKIHYMKDKLFKKIIKEIAEESKPNIYKTTVILMLQNEPLLDPSLIEKIKFVNKFNNLFTGVTTNGSLLNDKIITKLESSGLGLLTVSIDSINKKTFEGIRKGLDFDRIMKNMELLENSSLRRKTKIRMTIQKNNYLQIKDFIKFWEDRGFKVELYGVSNRCCTLKIFDTIKTDEQILAEIKEVYKDYFYKDYVFASADTCLRIFYWFSILYNGDVIQCCNDWEHEEILGNVKNDKIKEVLNSNLFKKYKTLHLNSQRYKIKICKDCSLLNNTQHRLWK